MVILEPEKTPRTKSDNYKIEKDFALEKALEIELPVCLFDMWQL